MASRLTAELDLAAIASLRARIQEHKLDVLSAFERLKLSAQPKQHWQGSEHPDAGLGRFRLRCVSTHDCSGVQEAGEIHQRAMRVHRPAVTKQFGCKRSLFRGHFWFRFGEALWSRILRGAFAATTTAGDNHFEREQSHVLLPDSDAFGQDRGFDAEDSNTESDSPTHPPERPLTLEQRQRRHQRQQQMALVLTGMPMYEMGPIPLNIVALVQDWFIPRPLGTCPHDMDLKWGAQWRPAYPASIATFYVNASSGESIRKPTRSPREMEGKKSPWKTCWPAPTSSIEKGGRCPCRDSARRVCEYARAMQHMSVAIAQSNIAQSDSLSAISTGDNSFQQPDP